MAVHPNSRQVKIKLNRAFEDLQGKGYFAAANHTCCNTCGWYEVPDDQGERAVFYHQQNKEEIEYGGECHLSWAGDAAEIRAVLENRGLEVEHDGNESRKILVRLPA